METVKLTYEIDGDNFNAAGDASTAVKRVLKKLRLPPQIVRRAVVCMYEGEINMVIHAEGGTAELDVDEEKIVCEMATGVYRAGACVYLTYFAKEIAGYIEEGYIG